MLQRRLVLRPLLSQLCPVCGALHVPALSGVWNCQLQSPGQLSVGLRETRRFFPFSSLQSKTSSIPFLRNLALHTGVFLAK